jgi:hypothetical protein
VAASATDGPFAGLMETIMSKTSMHNSEASLEVRAGELRDGELDAVSGGAAFDAERPFPGADLPTRIFGWFRW